MDHMAWDEAGVCFSCATYHTIILHTLTQMNFSVCAHFVDHNDEIGLWEERSKLISLNTNKT